MHMLKVKVIVLPSTKVTSWKQRMETGIFVMVMVMIAGRVTLWQQRMVNSIFVLFTQVRRATSWKQKMEGSSNTKETQGSTWSLVWLWLHTIIPFIPSISSRIRTRMRILGLGPFGGKPSDLVWFGLVWFWNCLGLCLCGRFCLCSLGSRVCQSSSLSFPLSGDRATISL